MGLGEKQEAFAEKLGKFIAWTYKEGYALKCLQIIDIRKKWRFQFWTGIAHILLTLKITMHNNFRRLRSFGIPRPVLISIRNRR